MGPKCNHSLIKGAGGYMIHKENNKAMCTEKQNLE